VLSECIYTWVILRTDGPDGVDRCVDVVGPGTDDVYRVGPMMGIVGPVFLDWIG
jgi:hypothetical protein